MTLSVEKMDDCRFEIPKTGGMRVHGIVYADDRLMDLIRQDKSLSQVANVAHLPGIVRASLAMPDIHQGYGFPIGGVAAMEMEDGVISPGGVGYDINCGVRLLRSRVRRHEAAPFMDRLAAAVFSHVPSGVGSHRKDLRLSHHELKKVLVEGARWAVARGWGRPEDLEYTEEKGCIAGADPSGVSDRALERGRDQLGTLGSGNHFVEIGYVAEIFDADAARALGLEKDMITVLIHTGSRGFGYQVCDDYLKILAETPAARAMALPDRQLACAPIRSGEGRRYMGAMNCAVNFAFANRQIISHWVRESCESALERSADSLGLDMVYDIAHNIAKKETHRMGRSSVPLMVHRKGATRAYPAGHPDIPAAYAAIGQPVLIPGDMGRCSYVLTGQPRTMEDTFGTVCHGAGRLLSRHQAIRATRGRDIAREFREKGIVVRSASREGLLEEIPEAYKDVSQVVECVENAGLARKVVKLVPLGVVKG